MIFDEVRDRLSGREPRSAGTLPAGRDRLAHEASCAQVGQRIATVDGHETRHAAAAHRHRDLGTVLDVPDISAEVVMELADTHFRLERFRT